MPTVKHGTYTLQAGDVDLQDDPAANRMTAILKVSAAKQEAVRQMNLQSPVNDLTLGEFQATQFGPDYHTGSNVPVEWQATRTKGHGVNLTNFTFIIDMDDIPPGAGGHGPDRPHVGYSFWGTGGMHARPRFNGHIFIEHVPASRNAPNPWQRS